METRASLKYFVNGCSFHCSNKLLALAPVKYTRTDTKSFQPSLNLLDSLILLQNIWHRIVGKKRLKTKLIYLKSTNMLNQIFFKNPQKPMK